MAEAIAGVQAGYAQLSAGRVQAPLRTPRTVSADDVTLIMPFYAPDDGGALGLKLVSVFNSNISRGLPLIHSVVMAVDPTSGAPRALIEGSSLTAIRTGAASGAATDALARPDAAVAAIFGAGVQARRQLEAVCTVRRIERVLVYSLVGAEEFAAEMAGSGPIPADVRVAATPREAAENADIICTATTTRTPVFDGNDLRPGTHINGIGSFTPEMQEIDATTVRRARVFVDSVEAALAEAGDLIIPLNAGRASPDDITFFKSVGVAVQDAIAARIILRNGPALGLGTTIEL